MKKFYYSLIAATAMLFATTSCSDDEIVSGSGNEMNVSFTVQMAGAESRAIAEGVDVGKGNMANSLIYAVYEDGNPDNVLIQNKVTETVDKHFNVTIPLVKGIQYDIVFFAYNEAGNAFGITADNARTIDLQELTLNEKLLANQEAYDAFFKMEDNYTPNAGNTTVYLKRPFAQLNVGTLLQDLADAKDLDVEVTNSQIVVKKTYNQFNAFTGEVSGATDLTLDYTMSPVLQSTSEVSAKSVNGAEFTFKNEKFNVKGKTDNYYYLGLAYVLAPAEKVLNDVDVTFFRGEGNAIDDINTLSVSNVDMQRNYRTNIIGSLLTSQETFEIVIDDVFVDEEYNYTAWAGGVKEVTPDANGVYNIALAEELAWIAQEVNKSENALTFKDKTVKLISNIDLQNIPWTPIGLTGDVAGFQGTFDGNGHVISNLYIDQTATPKYQSAGLFGCINKATLTNFTIENAVVKNYTTGSSTSCGTAVVVGSVNSGANEATITKIIVKKAEVSSNRYVGGILGYGAAVISECEVDGIDLASIPDDTDNDNLYDNGDKVGGILGYANGAVTLTNNKVTNITAVGYREIGGIAGYATNTSNVITGNEVTTGQLVAKMNISYEETKDANVGEIVGKNSGNVDASNVATDVTTDIITGTATQPDYDATTKTYTVDSADDWMWLSEKSDLENGTIIDIKNDINLVGQTFKAINVARSATLTVKGNGNTISNAKIESGNGDNTTGQASFFYVFPASELTISDLTFDNIDVKAEINGSGYAAVVIGYCEGKATLTNVDVNNSFIYGEKSCGAIAGHVSKDTNISLDGCDVTNCTIEVKEDRAGGLIGRVQGSATITNSTVDDATAQTSSAPYSKALTAPDGWANKYIGQRHSDCTSLTIDGAEYFDYYSKDAFTTYLTSDVEGDMKIFLGTDIETTVQARNVLWGGSSTTNLIIEGNGNELKLLKGDSDWNAVNLENENGKLILNNLTWNTDDKGNGAWNNYIVALNCDVEMNNVIAPRAIGFNKDATLNRITVNEPKGYYGIYITAEGQTVTIDGLDLTATNGGRGIKVIDEYSGKNTAKVALNISDAQFNTAEKAAILVTSTAGADIKLENVDIANVAKDPINAVWVDEDRVKYADLVSVIGGSKKLEGVTAENKLTANADGVKSNPLVKLQTLTNGYK